MRLIDADALLVQVRQIDFLKTPNSTKLSACEIMKIINNQPTAYSVEKVVQELEESTVCGMFGAMFGKSDTEIIDIIKAGGVK